MEVDSEDERDPDWLREKTVKVSSVLTEDILEQHTMLYWSCWSDYPLQQFHNAFVCTGERNTLM